MAFPLLPLLLLGGAAVAVLASSKSSSSTGSSKLAKVGEAYTDDSAYMCLVVDPNPRDTTSSLESRTLAARSEFDAKIDPLLKQGKLKSAVIVVVWVNSSSAATDACSSLSKRLAGVPGTAVFATVINASGFIGDINEGCKVIDFASRGFGGPGMTAQDCRKLDMPGYAGIGVAATTTIPGASISAKNLFILADGTIEWSQPQIQSSVPPQQTQPTQTSQLPIPPQDTGLRLEGYDEVNNVLGVRFTQPIEPGSEAESQVFNYNEIAKDFVESRSGGPVRNVFAVMLGPVRDLLQIIGKDAHLFFTEDLNAIPTEQMMGIADLLQKYHSQASFVSIDGYNYIFDHSTGELIPA